MTNFIKNSRLLQSTDILFYYSKNLTGQYGAARCLEAGEFIEGPNLWMKESLWSEMI